MLLVGWLFTLAQGDGLAAAREAQGRGDYDGAVAELTALPPSAEVEALWCELYYESGLPSLALEHARAGRAHDPGHLGLLFRLSSLHLWLSQPEAAREAAQALGRAVSSASLSSDERASWEAAVRDFLERAARMESAATERNGALLRARVVSVGAISLALWLLYLSSRR